MNLLRHAATPPKPTYSQKLGSRFPRQQCTTSQSVNQSVSQSINLSIKSTRQFSVNQSHHCVAFSA